MADDGFWAEADRQRHIAFGRDLGPSDREYMREHRAQAIFFPALAQFRRSLSDAAALSSLMEKDFRFLIDAIDDNAPTKAQWDEKLA